MTFTPKIPCPPHLPSQLLGAKALPRPRGVRDLKDEDDSMTRVGAAAASLAIYLAFLQATLQLTEEEMAFITKDVLDTRSNGG